jgi:hypothetical protein
MARQLYWAEIQGPGSLTNVLELLSVESAMGQHRDDGADVGERQPAGVNSAAGVQGRVCPDVCIDGTAPLPTFSVLMRRNHRDIPPCDLARPSEGNRINFVLEGPTEALGDGTATRSDPEGSIAGLNGPASLLVPSLAEAAVTIL